VTLTDITIAFPLLFLAVGALIVLISGAVSHRDTAGTIIALCISVGAGLWTLLVPSAPRTPNLGLSGSGLSHLFTAFFAFMAAGVLALSISYNGHRNIRGEEYPATILFAAFGMIALADATDLLILFLGLEAMTFAFYLLTAIDRHHAVSGEAGLKFLLMGAVSAAFLAFGMALLYCVAGTFDLNAVVQATLSTNPADPIALAGWGCLLIGIAFKLSLVPAHLWTPDVYEAAPAPVVAFLSGGSKGAAILLLLLLWQHADQLDWLRIPLFTLALLSMVVGNLAALQQDRVRRMLAYSSIAQMGYVAVALLSHLNGGMQAAAFYAVAYGIMSFISFGAIGLLERNGCGKNLVDYRGRGYSHPFAAGVLAVALFSLAGIPPTVGFTGKFLIFTSAIRADEVALAIIGILSAAVSVYYYLRVVTTLYMKRSESDEDQREQYNGFEIVALGIAAALVVLLGLFPSGLLDFLMAQLP
jgi:NADH-quinone oxidoreductase subunit N